MLSQLFLSSLHNAETNGTANSNATNHNQRFSLNVDHEELKLLENMLNTMNAIVEMDNIALPQSIPANIATIMTGRILFTIKRDTLFIFFAGRLQFTEIRTQKSEIAVYVVVVT